MAYEGLILLFRREYMALLDVAHEAEACHQLYSEKSIHDYFFQIIYIASPGMRSQGVQSPTYWNLRGFGICCTEYGVAVLEGSICRNVMSRNGRD